MISFSIVNDTDGSQVQNLFSKYFLKVLTFFVMSQELFLTLFILNEIDKRRKSGEILLIN